MLPKMTAFAGSSPSGHRVDSAWAPSVGDVLQSRGPCSPESRVRVSGDPGGLPGLGWTHTRTSGQHCPSVCKGKTALTGPDVGLCVRFQPSVKATKSTSWLRGTSAKGQNRPVRKPGFVSDSLWRKPLHLQKNCSPWRPGGSVWKSPRGHLPGPHPQRPGGGRRRPTRAVPARGQAHGLSIPNLVPGMSQTICTQGQP